MFFFFFPFLHTEKSLEEVQSTVLSQAELGSVPFSLLSDLRQVSEPL